MAVVWVTTASYAEPRIPMPANDTKCSRLPAILSGLYDGSRLPMAVVRVTVARYAGRHIRVSGKRHKMLWVPVCSFGARGHCAGNARLLRTVVKTRYNAFAAGSDRLL